MNQARRKRTPLYVEFNLGRYYFRRSRADTRTRLPDDPASPEFREAYARLFAGEPLETAVPRAGRSPAESLGWLIKLYLSSPKFRAYDTSTQAVRRRMLEKLGKEQGTRGLDTIDRALIKASMAARQDKIAAANSWLTTVSNMFAWATEEYVADPKSGKSKPICSENPCEFVKRFQKPKSLNPDDEDDGHEPWSLEEQARFEAAYPHGTRQRLIYEVAHETGLRAGDLARVGRQHVRDGVIRIKTEKVGTTSYILMTDRLKTAIERGPEPDDGVLAFITGLNGKAMQKGYLGDFLSMAARKIGIVDRTAHGLRKSLAAKFAEEGKSSNELMAIFGWKTIAMAEKYTRKYDRERTALRAQRPNRFPQGDLGEGIAVLAQ
jgi:integrase